MYLFMKILVKLILIEHKFSNGDVKNDTIKENYKSVSSIFYWSIIKYYKYKANVIRDTGNEIDNFTDFRSKQEIGGKKYFPSGYSLAILKRGSYKKICIDYEQRHKGTITDQEKELFVKVINKLPGYRPDNLKNEIECLIDDLHSEEELENFFTISERRNFSVIKNIILIVNKIISFMPELDLKDEF